MFQKVKTESLRNMKETKFENFVVLLKKQSVELPQNLINLLN